VCTVPTSLVCARQSLAGASTNVNDKILNTNGEIEKDSALTFFKEQAVTTGFSMGLAGQQPRIDRTVVKERSDRLSGVGEDQPIRSGVFDAAVIQFNFDKDAKGEVGITRAGASDTNTVGAYYLPWGGMYVMSMQLPRGATSNLFITAGLVGCSVFASGDAHEPTIYHAGTEGQYTGNVGEFWEQCIRTVANRGGLTDFTSLKGISDDGSGSIELMSPCSRSGAKRCACSWGVSPP